jgi:glycosyltransferase involved in cell wall biosynthesis
VYLPASLRRSETVLETLSIVVPVYNEDRRLPILFEALAVDSRQEIPLAGLELVEVLVVDDGSTDRTQELLDARASVDARLRVVRLEGNRGKGAAVRAGVLAARGEYVLVTDVDLSTPLTELDKLVDAIRAGNDLAIGSRGLPSSQIAVHQPPHREWMGKTFNSLLRLATGMPYRDTQCGFKLFRLDRTRVLFEIQLIEGFAFDAELCLNASRLGLAVAEVPVLWRDNRDTKVRIVQSSMRMTLDLIRLARLARRRLPERDAEIVLSDPPTHEPTHPVDDESDSRPSIPRRA